MGRKESSTVARYAVGICCLAAAAAAFAILVMNLLPADPLITSPDKEELSVGSLSPILEPERIESVQFGSVLSCEGVRQGKRFTASCEEPDSATEEERRLRAESDSWETSYEGLHLTIESAEVLNGSDFASRYPGYCDSNPTYEYDWSFKVAIVEVLAENRSAEAIALPTLLLWGNELRGASDSTNNGLHVDKYALAELIGKRDDRSGTVAPSIPEDWNIVKAGESRTLTLAYTLRDGLFVYENDFDSLDERDLCLSLSGYDPVIVYRLWLG